MNDPPVPIEVVPTSLAFTDQRRSIVWGDHESAYGMVTDLDWHLTAFGYVSDAALTLARTGAAIFLADRAVSRNELRQRREIHLIVPVPDPDLANTAAAVVAELAGFVTGDDWLIEFEDDPTERPEGVVKNFEASEVSLLSGGLDSFCGALIGGVGDRLFLSHSDASVVKYSQNQAIPHIPGFAPKNHVPVRLAARKPFNREASRRSRSILFMALGVALAETAKAPTLEVPENGFTSLNPPLAANRGGVLTTRSTHPYTFHLATAVLAALGLAIDLRNPYEWTTKGELISMAVDAVGADLVQAGLAHTMSCAKSNMILKHKRFGHNCGLDYACIVRRAGIRASGIADTTPYESERADIGDAVLDLRRRDVAAVELAKLGEPSISALVAKCGPFPPRYDHERALDLWKRGHNELVDLPLP